MENSAANPYRAPGSNVISEPGNHDGINSFKRFSAWGVFGLAVITLGIYPLYWLYSRAQIANTVHDNPLSNKVLTAFAMLVIITFVLGFVGGAGLKPPAWTGIFNLAYIVLYFMVLFTLKNRLQDIIGARLSGLLTFFGSSLYLQYKINQKIDGAI